MAASPLAGRYYSQRASAGFLITEARQVSNTYLKLVGRGETVRLTTNPAGDFAPAWSPHGLWIAFLRVRSSFRTAIMIIPVVGGQEREVAELSFGTEELIHQWADRTVPAPFLARSADARWLLSVEQSAPHGAFSMCGSRCIPTTSARLHSTAGHL
ncbi:MAG TPA: hypothetical protein VHZ55_26010 [Bryobacteraceae bacterium]|jgi:hypothetical protein|nr:hypothetical protein [Bryobacteraceae bacterium]